MSVADARLALPSVAPLDGVAADAARARWAGRAKPPGALGRIEDLAVHLAAVTGSCPPPVSSRPAVVVFAGDHGVVADGVSAWPQEVTAAMAATMADGGAAVNAFAATVGASVTVVDVGVATDLDGIPGIVDRRVRPGTASLAGGPAMTVADAAAAVAVGRDVVRVVLDDGADLVVAGEMGIGNTTPASCLIAVLAGTATPLVGPGAGLAAEQLDHKAEVVAAAVARARPLVDDPLALLAEVGGLEIAAMAGCYLEAAASAVSFVVDGVIALSALLVADALVPGVAARAVAGHRSTEPAASAALAHLGLDPLLELDLRLGEGTGAVLAVPLVQAAARALRDMADLPA